MHYIISSKYHGFRAGENSPSPPVLAGPVFLKMKKIKVRFYKKQVIKKSASVIFLDLLAYFIGLQWVEEAHKKVQDYWSPTHYARLVGLITL